MLAQSDTILSALKHLAASSAVHVEARVSSSTVWGWPSWKPFLQKKIEILKKFYIFPLTCLVYWVSNDTLGTLNF